jgi:hypothetical protein
MSSCQEQSTVDEYVCLTVWSRQGESERDFAARLTRFWTHLLRTRADDYAKVYAEARVFEADGNRLTRQYLAEAAVADCLEVELSAADLHFEPIDRHELYSKFEAVASEWMQILH